MVIQYWHLALLVVLTALLGWGLMVTRRKALLGVAAILLALSGFAYYTLVLDEQYLDRDLNGRLDTLAFIGIPAVIGVGILLAVLRSRRRA
ncbi:hypothetical protein ACWKSP_17425 [Micromonosporaceae bacterium Da 78-11]